ncbi:hypothetical protein E6O75_ATG01716 [Venturia nashicola]|uniref:Uncharacterized protein n=1 Tax=Venturia nashicola TaxID=86259 RepID=A0A4Z1P215_9PEZI|nr:hypothetical protein E6O75_ATG01716 [Venturia nashicola]
MLPFAPASSGVLANSEPAVLNRATEVDKPVLHGFFLALLEVICAIEKLMTEATIEGEQRATSNLQRV